MGSYRRKLSLDGYCRVCANNCHTYIHRGNRNLPIYVWVFCFRRPINISMDLWQERYASKTYDFSTANTYYVGSGLTASGATSQWLIRDDLGIDEFIATNDALDNAFPSFPMTIGALSNSPSSVLLPRIAGKTLAIAFYRRAFTEAELRLIGAAIPRVIE